MTATATRPSHGDWLDVTVPRGSRCLAPPSALIRHVAKHLVPWSMTNAMDLPVSTREIRQVRLVRKLCTIDVKISADRSVGGTTVMVTVNGYKPKQRSVLGNSTLYTFQRYIFRPHVAFSLQSQFSLK